MLYRAILTHSSQMPGSLSSHNSGHQHDSPTLVAENVVPNPHIHRGGYVVCPVTSLMKAERSPSPQSGLHHAGTAGTAPGQLPIDDVNVLLESLRNGPASSDPAAAIEPLTMLFSHMMVRLIEHVIEHEVLNTVSAGQTAKFDASSSSRWKCWRKPAAAQETSTST